MGLRTARSGRVRGFDARDLCSGLRLAAAQALQEKLKRILAGT
jgi:hypothetical protein